MEYQSLSPNIGVKSVNETVIFYTQVLGFKKVMSVSDENKVIWAMVTYGNISLMFQDYNNLVEEYPELNGKPLQSAISFYIKMDNKNALYNKICKTEYLVKEMNTTSYGIEEFAIRDNNGFILTIAENTKKKINYDNFFFPVDDYEKSKKFYAETLGLKIKFEFKEKGMIAFSVGDEEPAIILKDKQKFPNAKPSLWIEVENVNAMYKELKNKDVTFLTEPFKIKTGWAVEFIDPSNNIIGLTDYTS